MDARTAEWRRARASRLREQGDRAEELAAAETEPALYRQLLSEPGSLRSGDGVWHRRRAASLEAGLRPRVASCMVGWRRVSCGACGCVHEAPTPCRARAVCPACSRSAWGATRKRVLRAVGAHDRTERTAASRSSGHRAARRLTLLTLAVPHTGDLTRDLRGLRASWARLRAWLGERYGWRAPRFVFVCEVTPGTRGDGHVHAHVVAWLPWLDLDELHRAWGRALGVPVPRRGLPACSRPDVRSRGASAERAARYVATYVSKGSELTGDLAARWYEATYARRLFSSSVGFWVPWKECPDCHELEPSWRVERIVAADKCVSWLEEKPPPLTG